MPTYADLATSIASDIGGPDNVISVGSCTTRLRFVVKDESVVDLDKLGATQESSRHSRQADRSRSSSVRTSTM